MKVFLVKQMHDKIMVQMWACQGWFDQHTARTVETLQYVRMILHINVTHSGGSGGGGTVQ